MAIIKSLDCFIEVIAEDNCDYSWNFESCWDHSIPSPSKPFHPYMEIPVGTQFKINVVQRLGDVTTSHRR